MGAGAARRCRAERASAVCRRRPEASKRSAICYILHHLMTGDGLLLRRRLSGLLEPELQAGPIKETAPAMNGSMLNRRSIMP